MRKSVAILELCWVWKRTLEVCMAFWSGKGIEDITHSLRFILCLPIVQFSCWGTADGSFQATWVCGGSFWWPSDGRFCRTPTWDWCRSMTSMRRLETSRWTADPSTIEMSSCYVVHNWMVLMSTADRMVSQILSAEFDSMSFSCSLEGFWKLCNQDYQHGGPDFWQWKCKV